MEEMNLRTILQGIQQIIKDMEYTRYMIKNTPTHKKGKYQTHIIHLQYLKRRLRDFMGRLNKKVNGTVTTVKFKIVNSQGDSTLYEQTFTNLTQQDISDILKIRSVLEGVEIEILEIKEIPTYVRIL